ncbi:MAG TPA: mersacidin/lichenicidin family type 2 lantibiotic [Ktedonobacteraceae bacterium]|nr:mersacidin/lichenicidin family type 2 lantibiotic [Ktedonobacteraceae bacterium]
MPTSTLTKQIDIVRAWKDEAYFRELSAEEQASVPANPAGVLDLSAELQPLMDIPEICLGDGTRHCTCIIINHTGQCTVP